MALSKSPTACCVDNKKTNIVEVTHPFHPFRGQQFVLVTRRINWGEDRVNYFDQAGKLCSMMTSWTNLAGTDYFLEASCGQSWFRVDDLLALSSTLKILINNLDPDSGGVK